MKPRAARAFALALASPALAAPRTSAPEGCTTVTAGGGHGAFASVQAAVDAAAAGGCIFLAQGRYAEQVVVGNATANLTMYGATRNARSHAGNQATLTGALSQDERATNDQTATLRVWAPGFRLYNVDVANTRGRGSQAVALSAQSSAAFYGCAFRGYQDTLLASAGTQLYARCEIVGATDFVFGQSAYAWFEACHLRVLDASVGYVTANGAVTPGDSKYVFNKCDIAAAAARLQPTNLNSTAVAPGAYFLGRPWRSGAYVAFQNTSMSSVVAPAGWTQWSAAEPRTEHVTLAEYGSVGDGARGPRANFSTALAAPVAIEQVLGSDYTAQSWYDASYMASADD